MEEQNACPETADQIMASIEEIAYLKWVETAAKEFVRLRDAAKAEGNSHLARNAQFEIDVFSLYPRHPFINPDAKPRFVGKLGYTKNGTEWPDIEAFTEEQYQYYEYRLLSSKNVFLKTRYADVLFEKWNRNRKFNKFELGEILVNLLLETSNSHLIQTKPLYTEFAWDIARAADVAIRLTNQPLLRRVCDILFPVATSLESCDLRRLYEMSLIATGISESRLSASVTVEEYAAVEQRLDEARQCFWETKDLLSWHRTFCRELLYWAKFLKWDEQRIEAIRLEIGQSYEEQAVHERDVWNSHMLEAKSLEDALAYYRDVGHKEKLNELKVRIKEAYTASKSELKEHTVTYEVPMEVTDKFLESYVSLTLNECLALAGSDPRLMAQSQTIEKQADELRKSAPLFFEASKFLMDEGRKVFQSDSEETSMKFIVGQDYRLRVGLTTGVLLNPLFCFLVEALGLNVNSLMAFLNEWPLLDEENSVIIEVGLGRLFEKDYVSALHILVPQFEACIRKLFAKAGIATTSIKQGMVQHEQTFNEFLERPDVKAVLEPDFHKYIQMVMVDQTGFNLRNDIAHGLVKATDCNEMNAIIVIHLFLILSRYRLVPKEAEGT